MQGKKKKLLTSITALICVVALLVGGTFAWRGVSSALNEFTATKATETDPGANLHDDFDATTGDKNIYVENTGDSDVYVRIRLDEVFVDGSNTPSIAWSTFVPGIDLTESGAHHDAYGTEGFVWTLGNETTPYAYHSIEGSTEWDAAADRAATDALVGDALGSAKNGSTIVDLSAGDTTAKVAPTGTVITMADYNDPAKNPDGKAFVGWIYDTDGYAYWSQPLKEGETTSLLLNGVTVPTANSETYYYAINAVMEYVDIEDLPAWTEDAEVEAGAGAGDEVDDETTAAAKAMLTAISVAPSENIDPAKGDWSDVKWELGETFEASGYEWIVIAVDGDNALIITKDTIGKSRFDATTTVYANSELKGKIDSFYATELAGNDIAAADETKKITGVAQPSDYLDKTPASTGHTDASVGGLSKVDENGTTGCFLLSIQEVNNYLIGTSYAIGRSNHAKVADGFSVWGTTDGGADSYFTRSQRSGNDMHIVTNTGATSGYCAITFDIMARPVVWITTK